MNEDNATDELGRQLIKIARECCLLFKRKDAQDFIYTQFVVIYALGELDRDRVLLPEPFHQFLNELKQNIAGEFAAALNAKGLPEDEDVRRLFLHAMSDLEFIKA
ncbi:MAG: hypothetical protein KDJ15_07745 [Alphaproteobacteria bacterium]|nr:hypothetical protein [Alphaproteobacteria bacterium]